MPNVDVRSLQQHKPLDLSKLSKQKRDWLEVFGNQWRAKQTMPGTCEACVWGRGFHSLGCVTLSDADARSWQAQVDYHLHVSAVAR